MYIFILIFKIHIFKTIFYLKKRNLIILFKEKINIKNILIALSKLNI